MATVSELIFPSQQHHQQLDDDDDYDDDDALAAATATPSISRVLADLRRSDLSMGNRFRSILADAAFVAEVSRAYGGGRPVVANERCGSWYVRPGLKAGSAYFKSTDGHAGQWLFSLRRLNLHLLRLLAGDRDGCVVVDSTRGGKLMPDALSKTLPVWCCVLNRVLFPELGRGRGEEGGAGGEGDDPHALYTPPNVVSRSEHAQIAARIPAHVASLRGLAAAVDLAALRRQVRKPLRPVWVTPESHLPSPPSSPFPDDDEGEGEEGNPERAGTGAVFDDFHPVICCTASSSSRRSAGGGHRGGYVQGAADDAENWALGLTPTLFWDHADELARLPEAALPGRVREIVAAAAASVPAGLRQVAPRVYVARLPPATGDDSSIGSDGGMCTVCFERAATDPESWVRSPALMRVGVGKNAKLAGRNLRVALPRICGFVRGFFETAAAASTPATSSAAVALGEEEAEEEEGSSGTDNSPPRDERDGRERGGGGDQRAVVIACETGGDLAVGVALALLCRCFDGEGRYLYQNDRGHNGSDRNGGTAAPVVNKDAIKLRLGRIMMAFPEANPSRTTLQSVNSFLMG